MNALLSVGTWLLQLFVWKSELQGVYKRHFFTKSTGKDSDYEKKHGTHNDSKQIKTFL